MRKPIPLYDSTGKEIKVGDKVKYFLPGWTGADDKPRYGTVKKMFKKHKDLYVSGWTYFVKAEDATIVKRGK